MYNISKSCQIKTLGEIYLKYFNNRNDGIFVEVGAYDGESFSNTSCLADAGWWGVYVEPVAKFYDKCKKRHEHNNITVLNNSVGGEEKQIELLIAGPITTTRTDQFNIYEEIGWLKNRETDKAICSQITLNRVLVENNIPIHFDLLVVDVEGNEGDVIHSFELSKWLPRMLIVELEDKHPSFKKYTEHCKEHANLREYICSQGYTQVYCDSINTVFVV